MDTLNVVDGANIGSNMFHMKKASESSALNIRKKSFKADNAGNKLEKSVHRNALIDLINIKKAENSELKPSLSPKKISKPLKISKSADQISQPEEEEEQWSDVEEMHNCQDSEDDYEDILPKHERLSLLDIENFGFPKYTFSHPSLSPERIPSPSLEDWMSCSMKMTHDSPFLDCDFFGEKEMKLVPLSLDYADQ